MIVMIVDKLNSKKINYQAVINVYTHLFNL